MCGSIALQPERLDRLFVRDVEEVGLPMGVGRREWAIERNETNGLGAFVVVRFGDFGWDRRKSAPRFLVGT